MQQLQQILKHSKFYLFLVFCLVIATNSFAKEKDAYCYKLIIQSNDWLNKYLEKALVVKDGSTDTFFLNSNQGQIDSLDAYSNYTLIIFTKRNIYKIPFSIPWEENEIKGQNILLKITLNIRGGKNRKSRVADVVLWDGISGRNNFSIIEKR